MSKSGFTWMKENKLISSFKRYLDEKRINLFPDQKSNPNESLLPEEAQAQIISVFYSLSKEDQNKFWMYSVENMENLDYANTILQIAEFYGILRNSVALEQYLLDQSIYVYHPLGDKIIIDQILRFDNEQHVAIGKMVGSATEWVIKWNVHEEDQMGEKLTREEISRWKTLKNMGAEVPTLLDGFMILDFPVLVMEKLEALEPQDYNQKLVLSVISFIEKIHPMGVLNNLKPPNILKKIKGDETKYYIADIGMMTTEEKNYGYQRFSWCPIWASQVVDSDEITTIKNDLLEFGYILNWLSFGKEILDAKRSENIKHNVRILPRKQEVYDWLERVRIINEQDIQMKDFMDLKKLALGFPI
jgi:hypothetical protein